MSSDITIRIACDPETDLAAADHDTSEADSLYDAWAEAMEQIASQLGLDVRTSRGSADGTQTDIGGGEPLERTLWQAAHDAIDRDADGEWSVGTVKVSPTLRDTVDRVCREEDIARGKEKLDAEEDDGAYIYRDDATDRRYRVSADDVAEYGAMLRRGEEDAYSLWCASTSAEELAEDAA